MVTLPNNIGWVMSPFGSNKCSAEDVVSAVLTPTATVGRISFNTDIYNDGEDTVGVEFIVLSGNRDDDTLIREYEETYISQLLTLNPEYQVVMNDWDREGGEDEWYAKWVLKRRQVDIKLTTTEDALTFHFPHGEFHSSDVEELLHQLMPKFKTEIVKWLDPQFDIRDWDEYEGGIEDWWGMGSVFAFELSLECTVKFLGPQGITLIIS